MADCMLDVYVQLWMDGWMQYVFSILLNSGELRGCLQKTFVVAANSYSHIYIRRYNVCSTYTKIDFLSYPAGTFVGPEKALCARVS